MGPEYGTMSKTILDPAGKWTLAHNTFLQAGLNGGIIPLVLFILLILYLFRKLYSTPTDPERILLTGLLTSFIILILFGDYLFTIPWLWILFGIILGKIEEEKVLSSN